MKGHSPDTAVWVALDSVTTTTTSDARQFAEYDYAELVIDSETTTAWTGTVQIQGSDDGDTFFNYGSALTAEGFYIIDPLPEWIKVVGSVTAANSILEVEVKAICVK